MKKKQSFTEKILLLIADFIDVFRQPCTLSTFRYWLRGDPRYRPFRTWLEEYFQKRGKKNLYSAIYRLKRNGYLKIKITKEGKGYFLTSKGEKRVLKNKIKNFKKKYNPDKSWLMVIFDIPEKRRKDRNVFREFLYELGFQKVQQSVWVSPYDVYKELKEVVKNLNLSKYIKFLKVKELGKF